MPSLRRPLLIFILRVVSRPRRTLLIAAALLLSCIALALNNLKISSDENRLFDSHVQFFRDYLHFDQLFPENEAIYVIVEARDPQHPPALKRWTTLADSIAAQLGGLKQYVKSVDAKIPLDQLGSQGLLFDSPHDLQQNFADTKRFIPLAQLWGEPPTALTGLLGNSPLERFLTALNTQPPTDENATFVAQLATSWNQSLQNLQQPTNAGITVPNLAEINAADPSQLGYYYLPAEDNPANHLLLVRVYHRTDYTSLTAISNTLRAIRNSVRDASAGFPEFNVGITGRPALEADEMRTTDRDSNRAEAVALVAVFIGLVVMLRSVWLAIAGEIALGVGIGWTFGWAEISVGELNLLSIVFLLALIGIGMDYLVQILTRYRLEAPRRSTPQKTWIAVFRHVSAPINTACLGAAGAFLVSIFTRFQGAAQLGIIAGGGLILCLLAGYTVLPAMLTIFPPRFAKQTRVIELGQPAPGRAGSLLLPVCWIALLLAAIPFMRRAKFDPSLLNMQSPSLDSVKLISKLQTWSAVVLSHDLQTLRAAQAAVETSPQVARTESILTAYDNLAWLRDHEIDLPTINWSNPTNVNPADLLQLASKSESLSKRFAAQSQASQSLAQFATALRNSSNATNIAARLSEWQRLFIAQLKQQLAAFHPNDLNLSTVPPQLKNHFVGTDGSFALYIYPKQNLWQQTELSAFVHDIESRTKTLPGDFTLTGIAINIYHSTSEIRRSFEKATLYALLLIFTLVLLDFRNLGLTLAAVSVLAFGLPMLVALMGLFNVPWNFANFFGLPILIGAGHEYGVFLVHRYLEGTHNPRRIWRRWDVSDKAMLLCAYITTTSFGFFWAMAHHLGLRSLGFVMALGTVCIYLAGVLVLRPILIWRLAQNIHRRGAP